MDTDIVEGMPEAGSAPRSAGGRGFSPTRSLHPTPPPKAQLWHSWAHHPLF